MSSMRRILPPLILFMISIVSAGCGSPSALPAESPDAAIQNAVEAAEAENVEGLINTFSSSEASLLRDTRPTFLQAADSASGLISALEDNNLSRSADLFRVNLNTPNMLTRFDHDMFSQFNCDEEWTLSDQTDTRASATICGLDYSLVLEGDRWTIQPYLPGSFAWAFPTQSWDTITGIMGRGGVFLIHPTALPADLSNMITQLESARALFEQLTSEVQAGTFTSDQAFIDKYNLLVKGLGQ